VNIKDKKYYWLKLKEDFFKRHDIQIIESQDNGEKYVLFYLKLLAESISHEGALRFSDLIPYDEKMLSTITNTDIDVVRSAIKLLKSLKMIDILEDGTIYMTEVNKMLGAETYWAKKKREQRDNVKLLDNVQTSPTCPSKRKSLELEKEIDIKDSKNTYLDFVKLTDEEHQKLLDKLGNKDTNDMIERLNNYIGSKGKRYKSHYHTILSWYRKDGNDNETKSIQEIYDEEFGN